MQPTDHRRPGRGPYGADTQALERELMRDPDVAEFADAFRRISSPEKRACIEWLVLELSRQRGAKNGKTGR